MFANFSIGTPFCWLELFQSDVIFSKTQKLAKIGRLRLNIWSPMSPQTAASLILHGNP